MRLAGYPQALEGLIRRWPLLFALSATLLFYSFWLTNQGTPPGDGYRILPQIDSIESSGAVLPFWDFQRVGGMPTFADPERFIWLSWFIDANGPTTNLQLNLALIVTGLIIAAGLYFLSRQLRLSPFLSAMVAVAVVTSQDIVLNFLTGRINTLFSTGIFFVGMGCLVRCIQFGFAPLWFVASAATVAVALACTGTYALFFPCLPLFALAWAACQERERNPVRALLLALLTTGALGLAGLCLSMPWFLPLLLAHLDVGLSSTSGLPWKYPALSTLPGLLVPLTLDDNLAAKQAIPLLAPLVCGGILIVALRRRLIPNEPYAYAFIGLILVALLGLVVGAVPFLRDVARGLPVIGMVRQSLTFSSIFAFSAVYLAALLIRSLVLQPKTELVRSKVLLPAVILVLAVSYLANASLLFGSSVWLTVAAIALAALVVAIVWNGSAKLDAQRGEALFGMLVMVGVAATLPSALTRPIQPNAMSPESLGAALKADTSYHRVFCFRWRDIRYCKVPGTLVENLAGFSLYFLPAHRQFLEVLVGREIEERRSHWATKQFDCRELNPAMLDLANVKYVLCRNDEKLTEPSTLITQIDRRRLLRRDHWRNALRVYSASVMERNLGEIDLATVGKHIVNAQENGAVVLDGGEQLGSRESAASEPVQSVSLEKLGANELRIRAEVDRPGVLVVPEYWAPGWSAKVNGESVALRRAFYMYRAVKIPAGRSEVVLAYWPPGLNLGLVVFSVAVLLLAITIFVSWIWPRSKRLKKASILGALPPPSP